MKKTCLILISLISFCLEGSILNSTPNLDDKIILLSGMFGQVSLVIGLTFKIPLLNEIIHFLFAFLLIIIPLTTYNLGLLTIHLFIVLWTLSIRKIYNKCIWRCFENKVKSLKQPSINWDILFPILGTISLGKMYLIKY